MLLFVVLYTPPVEWPGASWARDLVSLLLRLHWWAKAGDARGDRMFAPQAEDHSSAKTTTGVCLSRPRAALCWPTVGAGAAKTSYYSGIVKMRV